MNKETELIKQISQGDKIAFKEFYDMYSNKVYATALHYLQNIPDAEEVTQDVFVLIFLPRYLPKNEEQYACFAKRVFKRQ